MNIGKSNSGYRNSGYYNSGYRNSGDFNSGDRNSGNCNSGDRNSGNCNSGDRNSGIFNIDEPKMRAFNRECDMTFSEWLNSDLYILFDIPLNVYVWYSDMTDEEKKEHEYAKTTGGYLKTLAYKEAWAQWWEDNTDKHDKVKKLPNFSWEIFTEITGIESDDNIAEEMTMEQVCKALGKTVKIKK